MEGSTKMSQSGLELRSLSDRTRFLKQSGQLPWIVLGIVVAITTSLMVFVTAHQRIERNNEINESLAYVGLVLDKMSSNVRDLQEKLSKVKRTVQEQRANDDEKKAISAQLAETDANVDRLFRQMVRLKVGLELRAIDPSIRDSDASLSRLSTETARNDRSRGYSIITPAYAETSSSKTLSKLAPDDVKMYIVLIIYCILGLTFVASVIAVFRTANQTALNFAIDTIKTLLGFFIGVATAFMGLPVAGA